MAPLPTPPAPAYTHLSVSAASGRCSSRDLGAATAACSAAAAPAALLAAPVFSLSTAAAAGRSLPDAFLLPSCLAPPCFCRLAGLPSACACKGAWEKRRLMSTKEAHAAPSCKRHSSCLQHDDAPSSHTC